MSLVDVYLIERSSSSGFEFALNPDEQERADRFRFREDRERFVCSRGGLRVLLGKYSDQDPRMINFSFNDYGKPLLPSLGTVFNASHSGDLIVIGISRSEFSLGIDVEHMDRNAAFLKIADQFFTLREFEAIEKLEGEELKLAFYRIWTRKEAFIKAVGEGLSHPLDSFVVSEGSEADIEPVTQQNTEEPWSICSLELPESYVGACMVIGSPYIKVRQKRWDISVPTF